MAKTPLSQKKFLSVFIVSWLVWSAVHAYVLYSLGVSLTYACTDSAVSNLVLCGASMLLSNNLQYYLPKKDRHWYILAFSMFIATGVWLTVKYTLKFVGQNDAFYQSILQRSYVIRYCISFLISAFTAVISVLWYTFEEKEKETQREHETARLSRDAELFKLRQQFQPHFLFNSLNSINALIGSNPAEARTMVQQLSNFLRSTLKKDDTQWVALREELEQLDLYLTIEKVRFGNRLQTAITTTEESMNCTLPALILQPLVENAIKFGLYGTVGPAAIQIEAALWNGHLKLTITNPFDSDVASEKGTGFGLSSVKRRLYLLFGRNDLVETNTLDGHYIVSVAIPQLN